MLIVNILYVNISRFFLSIQYIHIQTPASVLVVICVNGEEEEEEGETRYSVSGAARYCRYGRYCRYSQPPHRTSRAPAAAAHLGTPSLGSGLRRSEAAA